MCFCYAVYRSCFCRVLGACACFQPLKLLSIAVIVCWQCHRFCHLYHIRHLLNTYYQCFTQTLCFHCGFPFHSANIVAIFFYSHTHSLILSLAVVSIYYTYKTYFLHYLNIVAFVFFFSHGMLQNGRKWHLHTLGAEKMSFPYFDPNNNGNSISHCLQSLIFYFVCFGYRWLICLCKCSVTMLVNFIPFFYDFVCISEWAKLKGMDKRFIFISCHLFDFCQRICRFTSQIDRLMLWQK